MGTGVGFVVIFPGMRIGVDASRAFVKEQTGTETYSSELLWRMLVDAHRFKKGYFFILYIRGKGAEVSDFRRQIEDKIKDPEVQNYEITAIGLPRLWTQAGLAFRTWIDRLDVLWIPAHTLPVLRRPGLNSVVTIHGLEYEFLPHYYGEWMRWHLTWSTEYAVKRANKLIAVSNFTKTALVERLGAWPDKITVVHEGVGNQSINPKLTSHNQRKILKRYGIEAGNYILFIGTIQPRKNLVRLIEGFSRLEKPIKLVIAGKNGWDFQEVLKAPGRLAIRDKVVFTGYIEEETRQVLLANAVVYVQPSLTEGFGLPILEAMQAGVPVACSTGGALKEVVGEAGLTFSPTNVDEMAEKLNLLLTDEKLRKNLIRKGKALAKLFEWEKAARRTLEVLVS